MNFKPEFEKKNPHDPHYESIEKYMTRVFARQSFQRSLTELEQEMRL